MIFGPKLALYLALPLAAIAAQPVAADVGKVKHRSSEASVDLAAAARAVDAGDCKTALALAGPIADGDTTSLNANEQRSAYLIAAFCEARGNDRVAAYRHALAGTRLSIVPDYLWQLRLGLELQDHHEDAAVTTVETMARTREGMLDHISINWLYQLDNTLNRNGPIEARRRLLTILAGAGYSPVDPDMSVDGFRLRYATLLDEKVDAAKIALLIGRIEDPGVLMSVSFDPRFRQYLRTDTDFRAHVESALAAAKRAAEQHSDHIQPVIRIATYQRALGHPEEALATLETLRPRLADKTAFSDSDQQLPWWWNEIARADEMLGRYRDEVIALQSGADLQQYNSLNVSQVINLAGVFGRFGHPEQATKILADFDGGQRAASPFGVMQMQVARGCAFAALGKGDQAALAVAYIKAHEKDAPVALTDISQCTDDVAGAAASFVRRLDDPNQRADALRDLSDYDAPPVAIPPDPTEKHLSDIKARPEVRAAIQRAGGTRRINLQRVLF